MGKYWDSIEDGQYFGLKDFEEGARYSETEINEADYQARLVDKETGTIQLYMGVRNEGKVYYFSHCDSDERGELYRVTAKDPDAD